MIKRYVILFFFTLVFFHSANISAVEVDSENTTVKIGVLAQQGMEKCNNKWGATADYLTDQIPQYTFEIVPLSQEQVYPVVADGQVDFIIVTPSIYVELEFMYHVSRIATMKNKYSTGSYTFLGGVLFCKADRDDIQNISDLKGKSLMGLHEHACTAWHAVRLELFDNNIEPYRDLLSIKFGATGNSVVSAVSNNKVDVGAVRSDSYERMKLSGIINPDEFRVLRSNFKYHSEIPFVHSTRIFPEKPFAKVQHTPDELAEKIATALIDMPADSLAAKSSQSAGWTIPHNYQPVHDCLKILHLSPYENYDKVTLSKIFVQYKSWIITVSLLVIIIFFAGSFILLLKTKLSKAQKVILEHQIMEISDNAYRKFSQSLHDGIGQQLTGVKFMAETLKYRLRNESPKHSSYAGKISDLVYEVIKQSRGLAKGMNPTELSENDLFSAIEVLLKNIENTFGVSCVLDYDHSIVLGEDSEAFHLYRIIQEAIHNAIKHGKAKNISVSLQEMEDEYILAIDNDGRELSQKKENSEGMGLHIMKYRASAINAKLKISNIPDGGVRVQCSWPKSSKQ